MACFILALSLLLLLVPGSACQLQCGTVDGSVHNLGEVECVLLISPPYDDYQWATCLTDDYIMRSSNQRHHCLSGGGTACWYQCMIEIYDISQGAVNDECRCSRDENTTTETPTDDLPPYCYSPGGQDCGWYRDCLEVRYPCEETDSGYAIEYAEKFCNLYSANYNDFSTDGRAWIDGVRKCLQVVLVPTLRPWVSKTCEDIRRDAFDSHPECYVNPASGAPGICELSCADVWRSFWLVNFEGEAYSSAPIETGKQMLSVMARCFESGPLSGCIPAAQTALLLTVPGIPGVTAAAKVVAFIAAKMDWSANGFRWFPFLGDDDSDSASRKKRQTTGEYTASIHVLLVDTKALNISNGTTSTPTPGQENIDQVLTNLASSVSDGLFSEIPVVINGTQMILEISSVGQCTDTLCNSTNVTELARAPPPTSDPTSGATSTLVKQLHSIAVICVVVICNLLWNF